MAKGEKVPLAPAPKPYPCELALGNAVEVINEAVKGAEGGGDMKRGGGGDVA